MDVQEAQQLLEALHNNVDNTNGYQIEKVTDYHLFKDILPDDKCLVPFYLITSERPSEVVTKDESIENEEADSEDGSPLKLAEFDISRDSGKRINGSGRIYRPLTLRDARKVISLFICGCQLQDSPMIELPVWVLCEPEGEDHTAAVGVKIDQSNDTYTITQFIATVQGPYQKVTELPKVTDLIKRHSNENGASTETKCSASYNILNPIESDIAEFCNQASLMLDVEWKKCHALLQSPAMDAKCTVRAKVGAGDIRSAAHFMFTELSILQGLANGLKDGEVDWAVAENDEDECIPIETLLLRLLNDTCNETEVKSTVKEPSNQANVNIENPLKQLVITAKSNLDFTGKLWNVLKSCSSYGELVQSIQTVLKSLQSGRLQPMLHRLNKTKFASLIRDSYYKKMIMPNLSGFVPLEMLLEIGIEKVQRDYSDVFVGKELITADVLEYFIERDLPIAEQMERLFKVHSAMELVVIMEQFLNLPRHTLIVLARHVLDRLKHNPLDHEHEYAAPVTAVAVAQCLANLQPSVWLLRLEANGVHCVCHLADTSPLPHVKLQTPESAEGDTASNYYLTVVRERIMTI